MNQGVAEGTVSVENGKGCRLEDVTSGGTPLEVQNIPFVEIIFHLLVHEYAIAIK